MQWINGLESNRLAEEETNNERGIIDESKGNLNSTNHLTIDMVALITKR